MDGSHGLGGRILTQINSLGDEPCVTSTPTPSGLFSKRYEPR